MLQMQVLKVKLLFHFYFEQKPIMGLKIFRYEKLQPWTYCFGKFPRGPAQSWELWN